MAPRPGVDRAAAALDHAGMAPSLIPCARCGCHVKSTDPVCPSCGTPLRRDDGSIPRTAVAVLLGLTAAGAFAASCGNSAPVVHYGFAPGTSSSSAGTGGTGGGGTGGGVTFTTTSGTGGTGGSGASDGGAGTDGAAGD